jgi:hypothetical protein
LLVLGKPWCREDADEHERAGRRSYIAAAMARATRGEAVASARLPGDASNAIMVLQQQQAGGGCSQSTSTPCEARRGSHEGGT